LPGDGADFFGIEQMVAEASRLQQSDQQIQLIGRVRR